MAMVGLLEGWEWFMKTIVRSPHDSSYVSRFLFPDSLPLPVNRVLVGVGRSVGVLRN